jgi:hypothetical protein
LALLDEVRHDSNKAIKPLLVTDPGVNLMLSLDSPDESHNLHECNSLFDAAQQEGTAL